MPSVPSTAFQLLMVLLLLLPGIVYQSTRGTLTGPVPDDSSALARTVRALGVSAVLVMLYAVTFGPHVLDLLSRVRPSQGAAGMSPIIRELAGWALLLLVGIPAALAVARKWLPTLRIAGWTTRKLNITFNKTPRAWDFSFGNIGEAYVRVLTTDGTYLGGWYGQDSYVSSFPEPREMFLEQAHYMENDGEFGAAIPRTSIYIRCDDVRAVEILDVPDSSAAS